MVFTLDLDSKSNIYKYSTGFKGILLKEIIILYTQIYIFAVLVIILSNKIKNLNYCVNQIIRIK
jgi:hypothetical protein